MYRNPFQKLVSANNCWPVILECLLAGKQCQRRGQIRTKIDQEQKVAPSTPLEPVVEEEQEGEHAGEQEASEEEEQEQEEGELSEEETSESQRPEPADYFYVSPRRTLPGK